MLRDLLKETFLNFLNIFIPEFKSFIWLPKIKLESIEKIWDINFRVVVSYF